MTEKKKNNEALIWMTLMFLFPVLIMKSIGEELTDQIGMQILYAGIFSGIGGLVGFVTYYFTRNKGRGLKIFALTLSIFVCGLTLYLFISKPTDVEILEQEWITQKIGRIEFESPQKLEPRTIDIPDSVKWFYSEVNFYTDNNNDRLTTFLQTKILIDTLKVEDAFTAALDVMLRKMNVDIENVELEVFEADDEEISSMFTFKLNGKLVNGYGFVFLKNRILESIWLLPLKKGFSREYIEEFNAGIDYDY